MGYMAQESIIFLLGIVLFLTPYLGIPSDWKTYVYVAVAILMIVIGYHLRYQRFLRSIKEENGERSLDSYVEATPDLFESKAKTE